MRIRLVSTVCAAVLAASCSAQWGLSVNWSVRDRTWTPVATYDVGVLPRTVLGDLHVRGYAGPDGVGASVGRKLALGPTVTGFAGLYGQLESGRPFVGGIQIGIEIARF